MNTELSFGQRIDPENGLVECWFTHGALDWIKQQDWSGKNVLMFGAGKGDRWLRLRCKSLTVIERRHEWCVAEGVKYEVRPCNDCDGSHEYYCHIPQDKEYDIIINDDAYRFEVIEKALTLKRPLILITDNWMQDYVFLCPKGEELLKDFEHNIYPCTTHTDHEGNCWKTAVHFIK